jgi:hypothetical protein
MTGLWAEGIAYGRLQAEMRMSIAMAEAGITIQDQLRISTEYEKIRKNGDTSQPEKEGQGYEPTMGGIDKRELPLSGEDIDTGGGIGGGHPV